MEKYEPADAEEVAQKVLDRTTVLANLLTHFHITVVTFYKIAARNSAPPIFFTPLVPPIYQSKI